jgi:heat shock protein HtpX
MMPAMSLTIRMLLAFLLAVVVWAATLGAFVYFVLLSEYWFLALLLLFGFAAEGYEAQQRGRKRKPAGAARAKRAVERMAMVADVPVPDVAVEADGAPLSWTLWAPWGKPRVHFTDGLLDRLDDQQLEAVAAHELMHVVNRDAQVMTCVGLLPSLLLSGLREMLRKYPLRGILSVVFYGLWFTPSAVLLLGAARIVSRQRELAADAGAARLTGSPAAVAGALLTLSENPAADRNQDLRLFHFLPPRKQNRLWATHPPTAKRIERLEEMERELHPSSP